MNFQYKKSLGQNFLIDNNIIDKISNSINPSSNDLIIEIGPGAGYLTKKLMNKNCDLICFEIDERLKEILNNIKKNNNNVQIVFSDFLKINLSDYCDKKYNHIFFVGNLPYYITTAIINKIISESNPYEITIMIQKEVANRFMAKPGTKEYNSLSVFLQYNFDISKICDVSRNCFEPKPKVDSKVIKLKTNENKNTANNEEHFYQLVKNSFKQKRKNLRNNLINYDLDKIEYVLNKHNKNITCRAEELSIDEFIDISNYLNS